MRIVIIKNISCDNSILCHNSILKKITDKYPDIIFINKIKDGLVNGHISIQHLKNKHKIWIFIYDKDQIHESEVNGHLVKNNNINVKKYKGIFPTKSEIEKELI